MQNSQKAEELSSSYFLGRIYLLSKCCLLKSKGNRHCLLYQMRVEQSLYFVVIHYIDGNYKRWLLSLGELLDCALLYTLCPVGFFL